MTEKARVTQVFELWRVFQIPFLFVLCGFLSRTLTKNGTAGKRKGPSLLLTIEGTILITHIFIGWFTFVRFVRFTYVTVHGLRLEYPKKLLGGYLNINSLRKKIHDLREIIHDVPLVYLVISETKFDDSFPNAQLTMGNYETRARKDRDKHGGCLI